MVRHNILQINILTHIPRRPSHARETSQASEKQTVTPHLIFTYLYIAVKADEQQLSRQDGAQELCAELQTM